MYNYIFDYSTNIAYAAIILRWDPYEAAILSNNGWSTTNHTSCKPRPSPALKHALVPAYS